MTQTPWNPIIIYTCSYTFSLFGLLLVLVSHKNVASSLANKSINFL